MGERNPIFGKDSTQVGYVEGGEAFDLSGRKRCNYSKETGNLFDDSRRTVGHVSLAGKFVGVSSIADELFPKFESAQKELRGIGGTPNQPLSGSDELTAVQISLEELSASGSPETFQSKVENEERGGDAEHWGVGATLSEATTLTEPAEQPSNSTEVVQLRDENPERCGVSETSSQALSEASQVTTLTEPAEQPCAPDPTEVMQLKDENEERADNTERRSIVGTRSQPISEASQATTLTKITEQPSAADATEVIQLKGENEQPAGAADGHGINGAASQALSEASQVTRVPESADQSAPDPTEAIRSKDDNEEGAADADRRGIGETPSHPLSEASQVTTLTELADQPSTLDPTEDKKGQREAHAERRAISGTPSQPLSKPSEATSPINSREEPSTAGPIEALHTNDTEKNSVVEILKASERGAHANRCDIGGTPDQPPSKAATFISLPDEPSRGGPAEALRTNDAEKNRIVKILKALERAVHVKRRGIGGISGQPLPIPSKVSTPIASLREPNTPDPTEALHSKDADKEILKALKRTADARGSGIGRTPSQPLSAPTRTPGESPDEPSTAESAEALRSNEDRVVKVLKALMKRSQSR